MFLGVLVIWFLTERFGWPQTGLVVPGYLASVFAIQPEAGMVVVMEALVTWAVAWVLAVALPRFFPVVRAFGRDRFFLILLASVGVRLFFEGGPLAQVLGELGLPLQGSFHSLGLVLVPLTANALWNVGPARGVPLVGLPVLLVYVALRYGLLAHTNLSFSSFALTYEDLSLDFISSPRAYMLLLAGAFLATWAGVRLGWDAGGIIIPGLLAVIWMYPEKLLATLGEVVVVVLLVRLAMKVPPLRTANLTGMRPLVLAFAIAYGVKMLISALAGRYYTGLRVTDLFGFGYLLPSLVAIRCWRYGSFARVLIPATATAFVAFLAATGIGFLMEQARPLPPAPDVPGNAQAQGPAARAAVEMLLPPSEQTQPEMREQLRTAFPMAMDGRAYGGSHLKVEPFADGLVLHSGVENLFGTAWIRPSSTHSLVLVVPQAAYGPGLAEAGVALAEAMDARVLLLSPAAPLLHLALADTEAAMEVVSATSPTLSIAGRLPDPVDLNALSALVPDLVPDWDLPEDAGVAVRLGLPEPVLVSVALRSFDGSVKPGRPPLYNSEGAPLPPRRPDASLFTVNRLVALERSVVRPLLRSWHNPDWARVASASAARLGLVVWRDEEVVALGPAEDRDPPHFTLWLAREPQVPMVFEVRSAGRHYLSAEVARTWWAGTRGSAILAHDAGVDLDAEALRRMGADAPEAAILRALVLDHPGTTVVSVAGFDEEEYPKADAIVSIGRPLVEHDVIPGWLKDVRRLVEGGGGSVAWYDGASERIRFYDPSNPRRDVVTYAGGQYVTVFLSPLYRLRFASPLHSLTFQAILADAGIPIREGVSLDQMLSAPAMEPEAAEKRFSSALKGISRHTTTGHPGELGRLRRRAMDSGLSTWAFVDALDGLPYLVVEDGTARLVTALGRSRGVRAEPSAGPEAVRIDGFSMAVRRGGGP